MYSIVQHISHTHTRKTHLILYIQKIKYLKINEKKHNFWNKIQKQAIQPIIKCVTLSPSLSQTHTAQCFSGNVTHCQESVKPSFPITMRHVFDAHEKKKLLMLNICHAVWLNVLCFHPCDTRQKLTVSNCTQQNNHQTHRKLHCVIYYSNADTKMHSLQVFIYHFAPLFQGYFEYSI